MQFSLPKALKTNGYVALHDADDHELLPSSDIDATPAHGILERVQQSVFATGWMFFMGACILSFILSTINAISLSALLAGRAIPPPVRTPTVYMGLETIRSQDSIVCRSRSTFPKAFSTFRGTSIASRERVHAPYDRMTLSFGGGTSALVDFYVPDFGLENCTLTAKRVASSAEPGTLPDADIDVWLLLGEDSLQDRIFLDTLRLSYQSENTTRPFFCPSRSHLFLQWICPAEGCRVQFPLEGVTAMTASSESLTQTGIRLNQYEGLSCI